MSERGAEQSAREIAPKEDGFQCTFFRAAVLIVGLGSAFVFLSIKLLQKQPAALPQHMAKHLQQKPLADQRIYQYSMLQNGLHVLNIQDPQTSKSAVSMGVRAGSYDDPVEFPGLAHFCEHMLFMGTSNYPDPSGFDKFLSRSDGSTNAYTASEATVYFASAAPFAQDELLSRFSDFFKAPLFARGAVKKEVHAIDSEHEKNIQNQMWQTMAVFNALASNKSVAWKFATGNFQTLYEEPKKKGLDPVDALQLYFHRRYCAPQMRLVTISSDPLDKQLADATKLFGAVPQGDPACNASSRNFANPAPYPPELMGKFVQVKGVEPNGQLWIHFELPNLLGKYKSQPLTYLNYVLCYGGENSLNQVMNDLGLISDMSVSTDGSTAGTTYFLVMGLTPLGAQNVPACLDLLYAYLGELRRAGVDSSLYSSLSNISMLSWNWQEPAAPMDAASSFAEKMTRLPSDDLLGGDDLIAKPDPKLVSALLQLLVPSNMNVAFVVPSGNWTEALSSNPQVQTLPYYGVQYLVSDVREAMPLARDRWESWLKAPDSLGEQLPQTLLSYGLNLTDVSVLPRMPGSIQGIPQELSLNHMKVKEAVAMKTSAKTSAHLFGPLPNQISLAQTSTSVVSPSQETHVVPHRPEVWCRSGWVTTSPKVSLIALLRPLRRADEPEPTVQEEVQLGLFRDLLNEALVPKLFDLVTAGSSYSVDISPKGLSLELGGFQPLIPRLGEKLLEVFNSVSTDSDAATRKRYSKILQQFKSNLATFSEIPATYAVSDRNLVLTRGGFSRDESLKALENLTEMGTVRAAGNLLLVKPLKLLALAMGNLGQDEAHQALAGLSSGLVVPQWASKDQVLSVDGSMHVDRVLPVVDPSAPVEIRKQNPRPGDPNSVAIVTLLYGVGTVEGRVLLSILGQLLQSAAFDELRTKRQLGYVVSGGASQISNVLYVSTVVQGTKLGADDLEAAIESVFGSNMPELLKAMTPLEFKSQLKSFREELLQPPLGPSDELSHFWEPLKQGGDCLEVRDEMLRYLSSGRLTQQLLIDTWLGLATPSSGARKKITVKYFPNGVPARPTLAAAKDMWAKQGVPKTSWPMLTEELSKVMVFNNASSAVRQTLLGSGSSYYSQDLQCHLNSTTDSTPKAPIMLQQQLSRARVKGFLGPDVA